ncbi:MAG TPA: SMP-30/gluconolactonase/LRE family protein [Alphaproteobacteria bacterium]|nr:SMP-30/gluconolactonase/LRE family protein [Alphaproteobacteria bacterium]
MYPTPLVIETRVFARIPDRYRIRGRSSHWIDVHRGGQATECFLEGPSFDRAGNLHLVDVAWGRVFRISPAGEVDLLIEYDGEPNGLKIHRDGRIFIADFRHGILSLDPRSGALSAVLDRAQIPGFKGPNDLVFAENGDLYFTDQGSTGLHDPAGRVCRLRTDGGLDMLISGIPSPNGIAISRDQATLYVSVTRDNAVWRAPLGKDGKAFKVGAFLRLSGGVGPDGLALDQNGGLAVAHLGLGSVWLFNAQGEPTARIRSCAGSATTNIAFGGPERRHLYITESDSSQVLIAELPVAGLPMFSHSHPEVGP